MNLGDVRRVLYLNHYTAIYGSENSLFELVTHLDRGRFEPLVVLPDEGPLTQELRSVGVATIAMPLCPLKARNPFPYLKTVWDLICIILGERIALVHANSDLSGQYGIVAGQLAGRPTVCSTRNLLGPRAYQRSCLGWADALVANSRATAATWLPNSRQKRCIVYNAVDLAEFTPTGRRTQLRRQWGLDEQTFVMTVIGRVTPAKGQDTFLKALAQVVTRVPRTHAFLVGSTEIDRSGDFLLTLKRMVRTLGLSDRVTFADAVESVPAFLEMVDLLVCPSVAEPFGRVLIEAMAMERPVIASAAGGPLEVVVEGETGLLVPPSAPYALAGAMLRVIHSPEMARAMGLKGRQRVQEMFSIDRHVEQVEQIYREILSC